MADESLMVDDDILDTVEELRTNYPLVSAILDKVPEMDLE
jgi:hypothetical protein